MAEFSAKAGAAIVTGGTGGIGQAICRELAAAGSAVAFTYRSNATAAEQLVNELSTYDQQCSATGLDLVDTAATATFVDGIVDTFGAINTVIHAAGPHVPMTYLSDVTPAGHA